MDNGCALSQSPLTGGLFLARILHFPGVCTFVLHMACQAKPVRLVHIYMAQKMVPQPSKMMPSVHHGLLEAEGGMGWCDIAAYCAS